jgi:type I site-specific restriction-modification system R (restriction) subunit
MARSFCTTIFFNNEIEIKAAKKSESSSWQPGYISELSQRENIIVIADEAHRTQYGFKAKTIDDKNEAGDVIGKKIV